MVRTTFDITVKPLKSIELSSPLALFSLMAELPWAMWLDSCQSDHVDSRYDIMVWQPEVTLSTFGADTHIHWLTDNKKTISREDPLLLIKQCQQTAFENITIEKSSLPFVCGAMGYFGYDLGKRFEKLPNIAEQDIKLAEMAIGIYNQAIIFDNKINEYFLICYENKRLAIETWLNERYQVNVEPDRENKTPSSTITSTTNTDESPFTLTSKWQSNMTREAYGEKFSHVHDYLLSGDCYQINLAQRFTATYQGDEFSAYQTLRKANDAPFSAFMRFDESAILSISPERFLQSINGKVQSKPIKGTRPRSNDKAEDDANATSLQHATKDKAENLMIVDLLRNDMSKVCQPGTVVVPQLFTIESFPAVHHLVSTVEGELSAEFDGFDLLRGAFPGGSITGAPKIRAMEIIEELEPHRRSVYCGSIGYISTCGNVDTSITIRTLVCENNNIHCWAGGGLVADSKVDCEYQETFDKVSRILPILSDM